VLWVHRVLLAEWLCVPLLCNLGCIIPLTPLPSPAAKSSLRMQGDFSDAVPFLKRPVNLDGTYIGDVGFDPLVSFPPRPIFRWLG